MKTLFENKMNMTILALASLVLSSCVPTNTSGLRSRDSSNIVSSGKVGLYQGKVLTDNPIILSRNADLSDSYDLNKLLTTVDITTESFLKGNASCYGLDFCFEVRENKDSPSPLQTNDGKWGFNATTPQFLQVNTFYHLNKITDMFYKNLTNSYDLAYSGVTKKYNTALPLTLRQPFGKFNVGLLPLTAYADCDEPDNAYFDRALGVLCFGYLTDVPSVRWAQDSTVVYHETGHFLQKFQLNIRNSLVGPRVDMGNLNYDEAAAIGEGLSDFYSFFVNGRPHFAEWAAGRFLKSSRPMTEDDPIHISALSSDPDQRLSYPNYLNYNPNYSTVPFEDVHIAGMIISHYLVALTADIQDKCLMTKSEASNYVIHLVSETLAEHGDLTTKGVEDALAGRINHTNAVATLTDLPSDWFRLVNPITYRTFMQTFAKNLLNTLGNNHLNTCAGGVYNKDQIESLIDQYGLLLFRTYNENRNVSDPQSPTYKNTIVNSNNRKKSVMINKDLLIFDPTTNSSNAFVIDNRAQILSGLASLKSVGILTEPISNQTPNDLGFNNGNGKISPGEIVGISLNLYNNSNSTMGGIQVLANDWNHADATGKPCRFPTTMSSDNWPLTAEGGVPCTTSSAATAADFAPVCFMQYNDSTSTKWVSQKEFRNKIALDSSMCLNSANDKDCFIRALKGADQAHFSKLDPKATFGKTLANPTTGKAPTLTWANILLFEVSKHIPPGTVIDCRLRLRFTNCDECYHKQSVDPTKTNYSVDATHKIDGYDFSDTELNGPAPYKIIHLQIPITD
jgi:hypothetical protein